MEELKDTINNRLETEIDKIGEQKLAEKDIRQRQFMEESGHGGIFFKNLKGQYVMVNDKALDIFGLSREQVIGKDDFEISLNKKEAQESIEYDRLIFETGRPTEVTKRLTDAAGKPHWYHFIKTPQFDDKGNIIGLVGIIRDITERKTREKAHAEIIETEKKKAGELKKAYEVLQESKDALVRSEKLAYTGRIAAGIAHEIRNPLSNVVLSIQQLKKICNQAESGDIGLRHIEIIQRNTERINYLITELLNCARPSKLNLRPFNLHKVLRGVLESTRAKIVAQKIKVVRRFTYGPPQIIIDRDQIERAFLNITLNAIEAVRKGGKLIISTEVDKSSFIVKIQDNGKGIPEKDIIRIFDPFFSTKPDGVGLGLTLCYGIIVGHGGTIEVESKLRRGTIFTVSLPIGQKLSVVRGG